MKYRQVATTIFVLSSGAALAGFDDYPVSSLAETAAKYSISADDPAIQKPGDVMLDMALHPAKSRVLCGGQVRPISVEHREFMEHLFGARQQPQIPELFKDEVLCTEGDTNYWLPIQAKILPYFRSEVVADRPVDLYVMHLGAVRGPIGNFERLFAINEFKVPDAVQQRVPADAAAPRR